MASKFVLSLVLCVLVCGCIEEAEVKGKQICPDGSVVDDLILCKPTTTADNYAAKVKGCEKIPGGEERDVCFTSLAVDYRRVELCDKVNDTEWIFECYGRLNSTYLMPFITTSTSSTVTTTHSTTTSTILLCGNGVIDAGEVCDPGALCGGYDGVCKILYNGKLAICLYENNCDYNSQTTTAGRRYDLGRCEGCNGPTLEYPCTCLGELQPTNTTTTTLKEGHYACSDGQCLWTAGNGTEECTVNRECFHFECEDGECILDKTPGNNTCTGAQDCITIWD
ncbi:MAG: hypothetical protein V1744_02785 [Candidatus Altiarchaeota archaeon]